jgi:hypothetical protein
MSLDCTFEFCGGFKERGSKIFKEIKGVGRDID